MSKFYSLSDIAQELDLQHNQVQHLLDRVMDEYGDLLIEEGGDILFDPETLEMKVTANIKARITGGDHG